MKKQALLWEKLEKNRVRCYLCTHECRIADSSYGICAVRQNIGGSLYTLFYGEAIAARADPIEKKPLYHFLPGSRSYSIATVGCNFQCSFCQNWQISQITKPEVSTPMGISLMPEKVVQEAKKHDCKSISYTYTEPTIFFEYAYDTARLAKEQGIRNIFITNGYMTKQALDIIGPYLDAANVDLKSFKDSYYRNVCKATLKPVLDSISHLYELDIWVEITTLIIPGENDSTSELAEIAGFIAQVSEDIPWHISRFHPEYKFNGSQPTPLETMEMAREIGMERGLHYVYLGNIPEASDTYCPYCGHMMINRSHVGCIESKLVGGKCPACGHEIAGIWSP